MIPVSDPARHKTWVGVDNARIKANYQRAHETFPQKTLIARTPVIPGVNDDEEHIRAVLAFIRPYPNVVDYELLPYHRCGESKYSFLGRVYGLRDFPSLPADTLRRLRGIIDEAFGRESRQDAGVCGGEPPRPCRTPVPKPRPHLADGKDGCPAGGSIRCQVPNTAFREGEAAEGATDGSKCGWLRSSL